jgi:hypothetical protein
LISNATGVRIIYSDTEKINSNKISQTNKSNIRDTPTQTYKEYYDLTKKFLNKEYKINLKALNSLRI